MLPRTRPMSERQGRTWRILPRFCQALECTEGSAHALLFAKRSTAVFIRG